MQSQEIKAIKHATKISENYLEEIKLAIHTFKFLGYPCVPL